MTEGLDGSEEMLWGTKVCHSSLSIFHSTTFDMSVTFLIAFPLLKCTLDDHSDAGSCQGEWIMRIMDGWEQNLFWLWAHKTEKMAYGKFLRQDFTKTFWLIQDFISVTHCTRKQLFGKGQYLFRIAGRTEREGGGTDGAVNESDPQSTVSLLSLKLNKN